MNKPIAVELPEAINYGAVELKDWIAKHTFRGVLVALGLTLLLFLFVIISAKLQYQKYFSPITAITSVDISMITTPDQGVDDTEIAPPPDIQVLVNHGPASRAGNPVAIPDAEITVDIEFSSIEEVDRASNEGGDGEDDGGFSEGISMELEVPIEPEVELAFEDFIAVEKEPQVSNLNDLMKLVKYPEMAKRAGIEGVVTVGVLIGKDGKPVKTRIVNSANANLNAAAISAIMAYRGYTPAVQNKSPVACWVIVPINFKLRN